MRRPLFALLVLCACGTEASSARPAADVQVQDVSDVADVQATDVPDVSSVDTGGDAAAADVPVVLPACATVTCKTDEYCEPATLKCIARPGEALAALQRHDCTFGPGTTAAQALGKEWPVGKDIPIDHIVLTMMENRSFDHYFGAATKLGWDVDGFADGAGNPDASGAFVPIFHTVTACVQDVAHGWASVHKQYDDGKMDGFLVTNDPGGERSLGYFDQTDLVFYYAAAKAFGISDRHFCSVLGPTWINRLFYVSATSFGRILNKAPDPDVMAKVYNQQILYQLDQAGVDWRVYASDLTVFLIYGKYLSQEANIDRFRTIDDFYADAAAGKLPPVAFVEPTFSKMSSVDQDSEHPPGTPYQGEQFSHDVIAALMKSPQWPKLAYIQTYDEHGGFYDHVPPPEACAPDDHPSGDPANGFDRYGIRVPLLVVSPWSR
jgi:phospholipase C